MHMLRCADGRHEKAGGRRGKALEVQYVIIYTSGVQYSYTLQKKKTVEVPHVYTSLRVRDNIIHYLILGATCTGEESVQCSYTKMQAKKHFINT